MVLDLKELKEILNREVVDPYDHRFLNHEVPPFDSVVPTTENIAVDIWNRLCPHLSGGRRTGCTVCGCTKRPICMSSTGEQVVLSRHAPVPFRRIAPPAFAVPERRGEPQPLWQVQ